MKRRTMLAQSVAMSLLPAIGSVAQPGARRSRVRPSEPAWPDAAAWERLNQEVGGHLIKVQSPLASCAGGADAATCQAMVMALRNPFFVGDQAGATQTSGWVDAWMSAPSVYAVAARSAAD